MSVKLWRKTEGEKEGKGGRREWRGKERIMKEGRKERKEHQNKKFLTGGHPPNSACRHLCFAPRVLEKMWICRQHLKNQEIAQTKIIAMSKSPWTLRKSGNPAFPGGSNQQELSRGGRSPACPWPRRVPGSDWKNPSPRSCAWGGIPPDPPAAPWWRR